jgi:branched-chain amino acid transport system permease protein
VAAAAVLVLAACPLVLDTYPSRLVREILIWGLFALSLDLLMGHAGMISFGHSAFFGIGGYAAALALRESPSVWSALLLPSLAGAAAAAVIGFFCVRVGGVYFVMLTLAFSQMFYAVTFQSSALGAEDGIVGVPRPAELGKILEQQGAFHLYVVSIVALAAFVHYRIERSPFGHVLRGIQENEVRLQAVGYPVSRYKLLAFVVAGTSAALAGSLYTQEVGSITPDAFLWITSGEVLLMVIIGGTGTFLGPALGAAVFILLQSVVSTYSERWMLIVGLWFVLLVLLAPGGILGALRGWERSRWDAVSFWRRRGSPSGGAK